MSKQLLESHESQVEVAVPMGFLLVVKPRFFFLNLWLKMVQSFINTNSYHPHQHPSCNAHVLNLVLFFLNMLLMRSSFSEYYTWAIIGIIKPHPTGLNRHQLRKLSDFNLGQLGKVNWLLELFWTRMDKLYVVWITICGLSTCYYLYYVMFMNFSGMYFIVPCSCYVIWNT